MQIIINQAEIERAISQYILGKISVSDDQQISMDLIATRGADGFKATIDITDKGDVMTEALPAEMPAAVLTPVPVPATPAAPVAATSTRPLTFGKPKLVKALDTGLQPAVKTAEATSIMEEAAAVDAALATEENTQTEVPEETEQAEEQISEVPVEEEVPFTPTAKAEPTSTKDAGVAPAAATPAATGAGPGKRSLFKTLARPGTAA